jgi:hypothetical protein
MFAERDPYLGEDFFEHEFSVLAILISTSMPSIRSSAGKTPRWNASFHIESKELYCRAERAFSVMPDKVIFEFL